MGWAARARQNARKHGDGNPTEPRLRARIILADKHRDAVLKHGGSVIGFSDRAYVMDAKGVLHRLAPTQMTALCAHHKARRLSDSIVPS